MDRNFGNAKDGYIFSAGNGVMSVCCSLDLRVSTFLGFVGGQLGVGLSLGCLRKEERKYVVKEISVVRSLGGVVFLKRLSGESCSKHVVPISHPFELS